MEPEKNKPTKPRAPNMSKQFLKLSISLGIVIVVTIFYFTAHSLIITEPQESTYCPLINTTPPSTQSACEAGGGTWTPPLDPTDNPYSLQTACNPAGPCEATFQTAQKTYELYSFIAEIVFGIVLIVISLLPLGSSVVALGLSYGGILSLIIASGLYWTDAPNLLRLGITAAALAVLIYIGVKKFKD